MIKIALCDDEHYMHLLIKDLLTSYSIRNDEDFQLTYFSTAAELLETPFDYNVLLLDLVLEEGKDGI